MYMRAGFRNQFILKGVKYRRGSHVETSESRLPNDTIETGKFVPGHGEYEDINYSVQLYKAYVAQY